MKEIEMLKEKMVKLKTELETEFNAITIINGNNNQNAKNIQNNINIHNKNKNKKNTYGKEDISYITNKDYELILNKGCKSILHLIEFIHCNKNKPENQNIYISNMRDKYILIFDDEQWQIDQRDVVLQQMIDDKIIFLINKFDELIDILDQGTIDNFKKFYFHEIYDDKIIKRIKDDIILLLYNGKL